MRFQRPMLFACCTLLAACAGTGPAATATASKRASTVAAAMADADAAVLAGHSDQAYTILKHAGSAFPTEKAPLVRMAQMRFDSTDYGQAIIDAQAALQRDPNDTLASSIVAVSGLRVTSKALADLSRNNNLTGNVRTEAQELAKLLRENINDRVLPPAGARPQTANATRPNRTIAAPPAGAAAPQPARAASSDPFGALK